MHLQPMISYRIKETDERVQSIDINQFERREVTGPVWWSSINFDGNVNSIEVFSTKLSAIGKLCD